MGLITKEVQIRITSNNVQYYRDKGYDIPMKMGSKGHMVIDKDAYITVKTDDLPDGSHVKVQLLCDYCHTNIINKVWKDYIGKIVNSDNPTCACNECRILKHKEYNMRMFGVEYYTFTDEFKEKRKKTFNKKYGVDWPLSLKETHEKANKTFYENGNIHGSVSNQQLYISQLYQGVLNYPCKHYWLDIFLSQNQIDVEYDGKGHNLSVKTNRITQEEFDKNEMIREKIIRSQGYKIMRIISRKDKLPSDEILLRILEISKEYFNTTSHTWINWDIDEGKYFNAEHREGVLFNFGNLRTLPRKQTELSALKNA